MSFVAGDTAATRARHKAEAVPAFSMIVPCFNEAQAIAETVHRLAGIADSAGAELIVIDDGSSDGSGEILDRLTAEGGVAGLRVIRNESNEGYGAAIKTGVRFAASELIVIMDADGTYPAERIPDLVEAAGSADMVVAARTDDRSAQPLLRRLAKAVLRAHCSWLVGRRIPDMNSGLRVFRRCEFERFVRVLPDGFSLTTTLTVAMMRSRLRVRFLPIIYTARIGHSKIRPIRDTLQFIQLILRTGMYFAPLRLLAPLVGLLSMAFLGSLSYDIVVLDNLTDKTVILLLFTLNTALFGLLADMIDKRS